jgi:sortase A
MLRKLATTALLIGMILAVVPAYASDSNSSGTATEQSRALLVGLAPPDKSDWSEKRVTDYESILFAQGHATPEGILRIPTVGIELPVYSGTEERNLTLGAGRIEGTPPLGNPGNTGIAGHRDGYFRALQHIKVGDAINIETISSHARYQIVDLSIVNPDDV